ncbi:hypothetical protein [Aureisphaera sp.]
MENLNKFFQFMINRDYFKNVLEYITSGEITKTNFIPQAAIYVLNGIIVGLLFYCKT